MNLHEAIVYVLEKEGVPLTFDEIAKKINGSELYIKKDLKDLTSAQIRLRVVKYKEHFFNINGYVVSANNFKWRILLFCYWDLSQNLQGLYNISDVEFIITSLFFFKRNHDLENINQLSGSDFIINFQEKYIDNNLSIFFKPNKDNYTDFKIFDDLRGLLKSIPSIKITQLLEPLTRLNTNEFTDEEFGKAFEYVLEINNVENKKTGLIRTPRPIIELMSKILDPKEGKIYDPVCGTGGFLTQVFRLSNKLQTYGSEINYRIAQIAYMNQMMNGDYYSSIQAENCFVQLKQDLKYEYIIGDLPIEGGNTDNLIDLSVITEFNFPHKTKSFGAFILFSLSKLAMNGKAIFTVSESFLFKKGYDEQVRNTLLKYDYIESVISLPNGALKPYTKGKASILVLNRSKSLYKKGKIKFINLPEEAKYVGIDVNQVLEFHEDEFLNNSFVQIVALEDVLTSSNLSPSSYTNELIEVRRLLISKSASYLSELVNLTSGTALFSKDDIDHTDGIPFIKIENLERDILDMYLSKTNVRDRINSDNSRYQKFIIDKECLLLAKIGDNVKPTYFKPENGFEKIILHSNVIALFPRNNRLSLEFLYYQFYSDFLINQIEKKVNISIMPFLTIPAIKELIVPNLDLNSQNDFIKFQKANSIVAERLRVEERFRKIGYIEDAQERELNIVRTITHQLKHHLTGISANVSKINEITSKHHLNNCKEYDDDDSRLVVDSGFEKPENVILGEVINKTIKKAESINNILIDVEKAINFSLEYSSVNIHHLINEIKKEYDGKNYSIEVLGDNVIVELSRTHFEDLFRTLIKNAEEHSFKNVKKYKISFNIKNDPNREIITIDYKNNGLPLNISEKEFKSILTKSVSSNGTGIGGYYINKIIEAHQGLLNITENLNSGVHFLIELPVKHNENG